MPPAGWPAASSFLSAACRSGALAIRLLRRLLAFLPFTTSFGARALDCGIPDASTTVPAYRTERDSHRGYQARLVRLAREAAQSTADTVFVGDSITAGWPRDAWDRFFDVFRPLNLGIAGDRTQDVLWRLQNGHLPRHPPRLYVLLIGTNNREAPEEVAAGVRVIMRVLHDASPYARFLVLGLLPRGHRPGTPWRRRHAEVNRLLAACVDGTRARFLDAGAAFLDADDAASPVLLPDGLHPSPAGYERLGQVLVPAMREILDGTWPPT